MKIPLRFNRKNQNTTDQQLGFEETLSENKARLLNDDGSFNIERRGSNATNFFKALIGS